MELCVFTKHLQDFPIEQLGGKVRECGLTGVDLTVRPGGHVEPEAVRDKLPEAKELLAAEGVEITMLTTSVNDIDKPHAREILQAAAEAGVKYFKIGYFMHEYEKFGNIGAKINECAAKLKALSAACAEYGIHGGYHNHSGPYVGALLQQTMRMIEDCDPEHIGVYFDIGHATMEGTFDGWWMHLEEVAPRLTMVALKDVTVRRIDPRFPEDGYPMAVLPMGEGIVRWKEFAELLKKVGFNGPVSFHSEYDGPSEGVVVQTKKDVDYFNSLLKA